MQLALRLMLNTEAVGISKTLQGLVRVRVVAFRVEEVLQEMTLNTTLRLIMRLFKWLCAQQTMAAGRCQIMSAASPVSQQG